MMKLKTEDFKKVQRVLSSAYKAEKNTEVGNDWERRVMTRIHGLGPLTLRHDLMAVFGRYVWRLAPVAAAIFLIFGAFLYQQMDFLSECELAKVFVETRMDDSLFQVFGAS